jgi:hypothetical protein
VAIAHLAPIRATLRVFRSLRVLARHARMGVRDTGVTADLKRAGKKSRSGNGRDTRRP